MVTTALLGLLTVLRHRADSVLDNEQKPYSEESDRTLALSVVITGMAGQFAVISSEKSNIIKIIIPNISFLQERH